MIELERHIEILLLDNDCVIVPGLGGFMAYHVEAHYDEEEGLFLPPVRMLGFNPQLKINDSLLVQSYVEAYDTSYPEALRKIEEEVNELKQHLDNEGFYELNDIGTLSVNDEGNLMFVPCEAGILTPSLYGLSTLELKCSSQPVALTSVENICSTDENVDVDDDTVNDEEETNTDVVRIKVAWIRNAVAVAAAVIALFFITTPISNSTRSNVAMSGVNNNMLMRLSPNEMAKGEVKMSSKQIQNSIEPSDTIALVKDLKASENKKDTIKPDVDDYCIVLASHVARKGANDFVEKLHTDGYAEASIYEHNKIVRVVYGSYSTEDDARKELRKLHEKELFEQAWIYKKK